MSNIQEEALRSTVVSIGDPFSELYSYSILDRSQYIYKQPTVPLNPTQDTHKQRKSQTHKTRPRIAIKEWYLIHESLKV